MRITIRLYKRHDLDLLALYYLDDYKFKDEFKKALKGYINGKPVKNNIPNMDCKCVYSMPSKVSFHIQLTEKDGDISAWINSITRGRRNNAMKNIFRNTFPPIISPYYIDSETKEFKIGR